MVTPEQAGERYLAVHHRMFRAVNDEMSGCGLSLARTKVLRRLREQGPTRQSVLAADFELSPHSISDIVDGLERLGMAERRPDPADRRAKLVAITDAGQAALDVANAAWERLLTQIFGSLSEADRTTLVRLLGRLDEAAQQLIAASAGQGAPATSAGQGAPAASAGQGAPATSAGQDASATSAGQAAPVVSA